MARLLRRLRLRLNKVWLFSCFLLLLIAAPQIGHAQDDWGVRVQHMLNQAATSYREGGYSFARQFVGSLDRGESESLRLEVRPNSKLVIIGTCDSDCSDLDLEVYDPGGNLVDQDVRMGDPPVVELNFGRMGTYRIVVRMKACSADPCRYGIGVFVSELVNPAGGAEYLPAFPWPPPAPSATVRIRDGLVASQGDSIGQVFQRLTSLLRQSGLDWSVHGIGDDGFALVTRLEAIDRQGRPQPGASRWVTDRGERRRFVSIGSYLESLFTARPGYYRFIVLTVTARRLDLSPDSISVNEARALLRRGSRDDLPVALRGQPFGPNRRCFALIYEFRRDSEEDRPRLVGESTIPGWQHLVGAGIWSAQEVR